MSSHCAELYKNSFSFISCNDVKLQTFHSPCDLCAMKLNPAYNVVQEPSERFVDDTYANVDLPTDSTKTSDKVTIGGGGSKKTGGKQRGVNVILAIAIAATLAIAVIAIIVSVLLTSNSNQEIQSLQLEIENLREMLTTEAQSEYIINYKYSVMNVYKLPQEITLHDNQPMNGPFT